MLTIMSRRAVASALAIASVAACVPGVASAAKHNGARRGSHGATTHAVSQARHGVTAPGGFHGHHRRHRRLASSRADRPATASSARRRASGSASSRTRRTPRVTKPSSTATIRRRTTPTSYANALVDYGMDNGCFFVY